MKRLAVAKLSLSSGKTAQLITNYGKKTHHDTFQLKAVQVLVQRFAVAILVVDIEREEIVAWIE